MKKLASSLLALSLLLTPTLALPNTDYDPDALINLQILHSLQNMERMMSDPYAPSPHLGPYLAPLTPLPEGGPWLLMPPTSPKGQLYLPIDPQNPYGPVVPLR